MIGLGSDKNWLSCGPQNNFQPDLYFVHDTKPWSSQNLSRSFSDPLHCRGDLRECLTYYVSLKIKACYCNPATGGGSSCKTGAVFGAKREGPALFHKRKTTNGILHASINTCSRPPSRQIVAQIVWLKSESPIICPSNIWFPTWLIAHIWCILLQLKPIWWHD